jgi:hypothetical protein
VLAAAQKKVRVDVVKEWVDDPDTPGIRAPIRQRWRLAAMQHVFRGSSEESYQEIASAVQFQERERYIPGAVSVQSGEEAIDYLG